MKQILCLLLCVSMVFGLGVTARADADFSAFRPVRSYTDGMFSDVTADDWYAENVKRVYELGLMNGATADCFDTESPLTLTEVIAAAARLHRIYTAGADDFKPGRVWYDIYVRYCLDQGIIASRFGCKKIATRAQVVDILSRALPAEALRAQNEVSDDVIPDVGMEEPYAASIYAMYRAGIVAGSDEKGTFYPADSVSRAEAAALIARMVDPAARKSFTLAYKGPDLERGELRDDSYFEKTAFLGNSLVDGLQLFADFKTVDYFCATSVTVVSAMNEDVRTLSNGLKGTLVEALCEGDYDKVYIHLGINEIGYEPEYFKGLYAKMMDDILAAHPDAEIYVMSVLPVTRKRDEGGIFTMERVNAYNEVLRTLAGEKECYYLDVCAAMVDEEGFLPDDWSPDGVHLYAEKYDVWEECIRTYYA